ncbi:AraC family transcriptional regulator, partial [Salmonella enterica subsp. enterica serovar Typhimurium]|uniref:AraC family transcriptional regulator n=1 Tax=Salmonella enterica TaxID=28901 RepID=UPI0020A5CDD5
PLWLPYGQISLCMAGNAMRVCIKPHVSPQHVSHHDWWEGVLTWVVRVLQHAMNKPLPLIGARVMTPGSTDPARLESCVGCPVTFGAPE